MSINWQPKDLEDEKVSLVPLRPEHFRDLYRVASDPLIWEQHPQQDRYLLEVFRQFFEGAIASGSAFVITDKASGEVIGSTRFYEFNEADASVAIGYTFLARKFWGGTYNKAVKKLLLDYAFGFVEKVYFHVGAENKRSATAVTRLGAHHDGIVDFDHYGNKVPHLLFVIGKKEWNPDHLS